MTTTEFLSHLRALDVKLWADGEHLRCNAPKAVLTPELQAELENRKQEILIFLREALGAAYSTAPPLRALSRDADLPLSFAQQRLWFLDQLMPGSVGYNMPRALRIRGPLNMAALERSLTEIMRRHEALRTCFISVDDRPIQRVASAESFVLPLIDLCRLPESERGTEAQRLADEEAARPFDLTRDLLLRAKVLRLGAEDHIFLYTMHHIASDGWSLGVFARELSALYDAFSQGKPSPLPELPIQYADFAIWQRGWLQGEVLEEQLPYWKKQLDGVAPLPLPTDRPRPPVQTFRGQAVVNTLGSELTNGLRALSRREGVTLFMTLLSAFQALLHRYTGQTDIAVGSPIANRNRAEIEGLIGFFVNSLVMRTDLSGNPSFRELLGRGREVTLGAYAHQDMPFEKLVEELQPERNLSHSPLFQVMFALQNVPRKPLELPGLTLSPMQLSNDTAKFDLTLAMVEQDRELSCLFEYNTDLFDAATITRMGGHFQTLLEGIVADPGRRLSELPILTDAERRQLLFEWNDTKRDYPKDQCIHELFEVQVERSPEAVAVVFEDKQLTYRQLNCRANQLAHYLRKLGVGPEVPVGICVERSLEMVIGLLGILKAGGAYVPLDPDYPKERLAFMLQDTQAPVLITQQRLISGLPEYGARTVCLDTDGKLISQENEDSPVSVSTADNLAYVMYTSGSTGRPKGVSSPHRAITRLVFNTNYVKLKPCDRVAQASNCSFDAATFEIWGALLQGARLVGITKDVVLSPRDFATQIREQGISVLFLTTALFNQLASEVPWAFNSVRHLLFGGEAVDPRWVSEVLKHDPPKRLLHVYGPTESTTFASWHVVGEVPEGATTIPIGRPIANAQIYLLDSHLQPVPVGIPGELYIGGDGLARGYLNRPELTAERFIPNPFSKEPAAMLYKTGDLARYLPDGNIEFLGRIDHQVKIRGFRIELGEIETVLGQHPAVREIVVLAREDEPGEKRLVAYVVGHQGQALTIDGLRSFLKQKLPEYMVPSVFVMLDSLPLTPSGKVDRRGLPAPDQSRRKLESPFVAPRTPVEEALAKIWAQVLKVDQIGVHDNFFDLGGHSLLATQVVSRIRAAFQVELPMRCLFESPTVAGLTNAIQRAKDSGAEHPTPPISPLSRELHRVELSSPATSRD